MRRIFLDSLLLLVIFLESLVSGNKTDFDVDHLRPNGNHYGTLRCDGNSDCDGTDFCYYGICMQRRPCRRNLPYCPAGFTCKAGKCVVSESPHIPSKKVLKTVGDECNDSRECRIGLICEHQICQKQVFEGHLCYSDEQCLGDLRCLNRLCKRTVPLSGVCITDIQCEAQTLNSYCRYQWNEYRRESIGQCRCKEGFSEENIMGSIYCGKIHLSLRTLFILIGTPLFFLAFAIVSCYLKHSPEPMDHIRQSNLTTANPVVIGNPSMHHHTSFIRGIPLDELPPPYEEASKYSVPVSISETPPPNYDKARFVFPVRTYSKKKLRKVKSTV